MRKVTFLLMRHPKHGNDVVGPEGKAQIESAARKFLPWFGTIDHVFATEKRRAQDTATIALEAVYEHPPTTLRVEPDLGFQYVEDEMSVRYPFPEAVNKLTTLRQAGQFVSVKKMCEEIWPPGMVIRHVMRATLKQWAERLARTGETVTVFVGNHATNVYATLTPDETDGYPDNCSIARYDWEVDDHGVALLTLFELLVP